MTVPNRTLRALALAFPLLSLALGCGGRTAAPPAAAKGEAEAAPGSDLDRPVAELLAERCEHGIPTHTCDECRYAVGVVKVEPRLFDPAQGGELAVFTVGSRRLGGAENLNGEVRLDEDRAVKVTPRAAGVLRIIASDVGREVKKGEVLAMLESAEFRDGVAAAVQATAGLRLARAAALRERELYERKICPYKDVLEAEAEQEKAQAAENAAHGRLLGYGLDEAEVDRLAAPGGPADPGLLQVRAPFAGTVLERSMSLGALVQPGEPLLLLADTSTVWVMTRLTEPVLAAVLGRPSKTRARAVVTVAGYPGREFPGELTRLSGTIDESTRTATARVVVANPGNLLRSGMFASVRLDGAGADVGVLALPEEAVLEDAGRSFVFVRVKEPYWIRRPVKVGEGRDGLLPIVDGVAAGTVAVARGAFLLKSDVLRSKMGAGCAD
jgi:membrane fusion protein, heavy metal efflux system